jgi:hypothetical protein
VIGSPHAQTPDPTPGGRKRGSPRLSNSIIGNGRVGKINALFRRQEKYCWVSRVVNHASLGPESGNFRALHRPEVPNFGTVCRLARVRAKEECRLREMNRIEWGIGLGSGHVHYR